MGRSGKSFGYIILILILTVSCHTGKPIKRLSNEGFMYAMIYDHENSPVSGVTVFLNGKNKVISDIQGRFILDDIKQGDYNIILTKKGYETLDEVFTYDPLQVLYFKMINTTQLMVLAETSLDDNDYINADRLINRALLLEPNRPDILFLRSIIYYLQGSYLEAVDILEYLINAGSVDSSIIQLLGKIKQIQLLKD